MATIKVSGLAAKNTLGGNEEILINDGGVSKKSTVAGITLGGEVTGAVTANVIASNVVDEANLKVSNNPVNGYVLSAQSGASGGLTWAQDSSTDNTKLPLAGGTMTGTTAHGDNIKSTWGTGNDLEIFHDGSHSYIKDIGTGHLRVNGNNLQLLNSNSTANYIICANGGAVDLYHNNVKKIETTADGATISGGSSTGANLTITSTATDDNIAPDLILYRNSASPADNDNLGGLEWQGNHSGGGINSYAQITCMAEDITDGTEDASLRFYTATGGSMSEKIRITSAGNVGIGLTAPVNRLHVGGADGDSYIKFTSDATGHTSGDGARIGLNAQNLRIINAESAGHMLFLTANAERMRILNDGKVGIGDTSPESKLKVYSNALTSLKLEMDGVGAPVAQIYSRSGAFNNDVLQIYSDRTSNSAFNFLKVKGDVDGTAFTPFLIRGDGKVGIGTAAPVSLLHTQLPSNSTAPIITFDRSDGAVRGEIKYDDTSAVRGFEIGTTTSHDFSLKTAGNKRLSITYGGNVGIATSAPTGRLHVDGHTSSIPSIFEGNGNGDQVAIQLKVKANNNSTSTQGLYGAAGSASTGNTITLGNSDTSGVKVNASGNVGIGATPPSATSNSSYKQLFVNTGGALVDSGGSGPATMVLNNSYVGAGNNNYATATQTAARIVMTSGRIHLDTAPSVSANAQQTFTTRVRVNANGDVGFNKNPIRALDIKAGGDPGIRLESASHSMDVLTLRNGNGRLDVGPSGTITILANGNTGVGTTSPAAKLHVKDISSQTNTMINVMNLEAATTGTAANGIGVRMTFWGSMSGQNNVELGQVGFVNESVNGAHGAFVVKTRPNGTSLERMRIDNGGNVFFKSFATNGSTTGIKIDTSAGTQTTILSSASNTATRTHMTFVNPNGEVGFIKTTNSGTAFATSSDYRLKENVDYTWDATTRLKQLKPARFNFIADDTITVDGFLAHEAATVVPEAVTGTKDAMTAQVLYAESDPIPEGKSVGDVKEASAPDYQGIDQSKLVPLLVKTIQELEARITALEA